jgi:hypothetical protein
VAIAFVKQVATGTLDGSGAVALTVPAGGVAAGNRLFVYYSVQRPSGGATGITDTGGNTWVMVREQPGGSSTSAVADAEIWTTQVTSALSSGNTISVAFSGTQKSCAIAEEYSGVQISNTGLEEAGNGSTGTTGTPSVAATQGGTGTLVVGQLAVAGPNSDSFTQDADTDGGVAWSSTGRVGTTGGSASSNSTLAGGAKIVSAGTTTFTYNPTATARSNQMVISIFEPEPVAAALIPNLAMAPYRGTR